MIGKLIFDLFMRLPKWGRILALVAIVVTYGYVLVRVAMLVMAP